MKAPLVINLGFSTIELMLALALLAIIVTGSVSAIANAEYWLITTRVSTEALSKLRNVEAMSLTSVSNSFYDLVSSEVAISQNEDDPADASCLLGSLCYYTKTTVSDISSCAKDLESVVSWRVGSRYPTSSVFSKQQKFNNKEIIALGGDCVSAAPLSWSSVSPVTFSSVTSPAAGVSGIDVLGDYLYVSSEQSPNFQIYKIDKFTPVAPLQVSSVSRLNLRLNDIDVVRDVKSGRSYAYVTQHSTTSQLAVYDVTDVANPVFVTEKSLFNVPSSGSFPQGWRVAVYGGRIYTVSRETTGPELHIFRLHNYIAPTEINSAAVNLNRTVNDMVVREQVVEGVTRRFLFLAASSDLKEVGVYEVTNDLSVEIAAINLPGTADASSLWLSGDILYVGRKNNTGAELYQFSVSKLIAGEVGLIASSEVGAGVTSLSGAGDFLYLGTNKSGAEFQVWYKDANIWDTVSANAGRVTYSSFQRLAPLGIDIDNEFIYLASHNLTLVENISMLATP